MRARCILAIGIPLVGLWTSPTAVGRDALRDEAVRQINEALLAVRDVTCTMIAQTDPAPPAAEAARPVRIFIKPPDKARLVTVDAYGNQRLTIENGNTQWVVPLPLRVSRTVWSGGGVPLDSPIPVLGPDAFRFLRSGVSSSKGRALGRVVYRGIKPAEGVRCHLFETSRGQLLTWIAVDDGLIRRQEQRRDGTVHVTRFTDIRINEGLDDRLFAYEPPEGARVDVAEHVGVTTRRHRYRVPHAPATPEQQGEARARLTDVRRRFARARHFSCSLSESYVAHAAHAVAADGRKLPVGHVKAGALLVGPRSRVRFEGERRDLSGSVRRRILLICDGASVWISSRDAGARAGKPLVVLKDKLLPPGAWKDRDRSEAVLRGEPPAGTDITFHVPACLLAPLGGIEAGRVIYAGEELIDGERTYRFDVKAAAQDKGSTHWIAVADGIPRRIHIRNVLGNVVETKMRIGDVQVDPDVSPGAFVFDDDGKATVVDMQQWRATGAMPGGPG